MNAEHIRSTILRILRDIAPDMDASSIDPDVSFHDQFEIDSIDFLRLMICLEKELNVVISDVDYPQLSTLNGCEAYLLERIENCTTCTLQMT